MTYLVNIIYLENESLKKCLTLFVCMQFLMLFYSSHNRVKILLMHPYTYWLNKFEHFILNLFFCFFFLFPLKICKSNISWSSNLRFPSKISLSAGKSLFFIRSVLFHKNYKVTTILAKYLVTFSYFSSVSFHQKPNGPVYYHQKVNKLGSSRLVKRLKTWYFL